METLQQNLSKQLNRAKSTISGELKRNTIQEKSYSPSKAQEKYQQRKRRKCDRKRILLDTEIHSRVKRLFLEEQWSPVEISARMRLERHQQALSYNTIYRAIYRGDFDEPNLFHGHKGAIRKLRHRGKTRHTKNYRERCGKIPISNTIRERPSAANERLEIGHWEADTVTGKTGKACIVTLVDRRSRFSLLGKVEKKISKNVIDCMINLLRNVGEDKCKTVTPDRGKEFSQHSRITLELNGTKVYFPDPHAPWQRGTNENTNGLLRESSPKGEDISGIFNSQIQEWVNKLNTRPRKCLNWKTPYEVFFNESLHLI
ncbi:IS30 family transposase [Enterococcus faecalis]|nr:IS30 family transposase [Enterococcus faecalis]EGO7840849.1 IS30 family transposase [Enterococcus faecalis]EGO8320788.1 IS30 family transposase [Enterococcus faecalis]EGS1160853.1 IS30 family transposase [Enterococcus faecalis]EHQ2686829.1 IS30 family transposase [Enterococcus faecalis]